VCRLLLFFFFSSRRRHTRSLRDWSSDVCSSDLRRLGDQRHERCQIYVLLLIEVAVVPRGHRDEVVAPLLLVEPSLRRVVRGEDQIGRASCRERVEIAVGAVAWKKKRGERMQLRS